ncbi:MAG: DUF302 domain-containing protein, partial [Gammaproteobacteria bacterium]
MKKVLALLLCFWLLPAQAVVTEQLIMIRSQQPFPETMASLQLAITNQGYTISRVQRVDIGLTSSGYKTDKYRVVFFGKPEEIRTLRTQHPELIPYLPLKIAIFAEGEETILVASNPIAFAQLYSLS